MSVESIDYNFSSDDFVQFSAAHPINEFVDPINGYIWEYRQGGNLDSMEAIIIIPSIYEGTNTSYLIAKSMIDLGYRVLILSIPGYYNIPQFMTGFDTLTASLKVFQAHLIGIGLGGFISLCLNSANFLSAEIKSMILISSFTESSIFKKNVGFFSTPGKGDLISELTPNIVPANLKPSVDFVVTTMDKLPARLFENRIILRQSQINAPIPKDCKNITVLQPLDWAFKLPNSAKPNKVLDGAKIGLMKAGGIFPHLAAPADTINYIKVHLQQWCPINK